MNPFYFGSSKEPLFGVYHPPMGMAVEGSAVLLCPPLGREYQRTHWAMRRLADQLARAGAHVLRFDYFATGDSAGATGDGDVKHWHDDIRTAAAELVEMSAVPLISIVGLRAGATLAASAAEVDCTNLVLWDPIICGSSYVKELHGLHQAKLNLNNRIRSQPIHETPNELLSLPFPPAMKESIEQLDLVSGFANNAKHIFLFSSKNSPALARVEEMLQKRNRDVAMSIIDDVGDWDDVYRLGDAYLPNAILVAIVDALARK